MDNRLDKYFRDQLRDREFDFKDSYWEAAEKMLDRQERRRRRGLLFWWLGGLAGLAALVLGLWFFADSNGGQPLPSNPADMDKAKYGENAMAQEKENVATDIENSAISENIQPDRSTEKTAASTETIGSETVKTGRPISPGHKAYFPEKPAGTGVPANENLAAGGAAYKDMLNETNKMDKPGNQDNTGTETPALTTAGQGNMPLQKAEQDEAKTRPFVDLDFLDFREILVKGDFTKTPQPAKTEGQPHKTSPVSIGVMAAQLFRPGAGSGEKTIIGYQGGIVLQYRLKGSWFVGAGLQYQYRTGTFEASKSAIGRNYRFGLETDTFVLRPTSLHYLSVPVQLGWQKGRSVLEAGLEFQYLLGLRGEKGTYERTAEPPIRREFVPTEKGWLVEDGYKKLNTAALLGYRYRVSRQLSFGLSAHYTFGGILKKGYEPPFGGPLLQEADRFYLDLRAVYTIGK